MCNFGQQWRRCSTGKNKLHITNTKNRNHFFKGFNFLVAAFFVFAPSMLEQAFWKV
jgi:hypothetical protein